jgi:hypothetical protein
MEKPISREEFLAKKRDYSHLLCHLTKDYEDEEHGFFTAADVLQKILDDQKLIACNHFCVFSEAIKSNLNSSFADKFKVVCFTETPIDLINVLLLNVYGRQLKPKPYGLVFQKSYLRSPKDGNPLVPSNTYNFG